MTPEVLKFHGLQQALRGCTAAKYDKPCVRRGSPSRSLPPLCAHLTGLTQATSEAVAQIGRILEGGLLTPSPLHGCQFQVLRGDCFVRDLDFKISQVHERCTLLHRIPL